MDAESLRAHVAQVTADFERLSIQLSVLSAHVGDMLDEWVDMVAAGQAQPAPVANGPVDEDNPKNVYINKLLKTDVGSVYTREQLGMWSVDILRAWAEALDAPPRFNHT